MFLKKNEDVKRVIELNKHHNGDKKAFFEDSNSLIELKNVSKSYASENLVTNVLHDINLSIQKGEFVVILGPSGGGKTTLMNIISGLDRATEGIVNVVDTNLINLNDEELTDFRRKNVSYVFQQYGLLPNLTVKENIQIGSFLFKENIKHSMNQKNKEIRKEAHNKDINKKELIKKNKEISKLKINNPEISIDEILNLLDLKNQENKFPNQLSGGQQQRVSIARAIIKNANILFADEPTGAVDNLMSDKILDIFKILNSKYKKTIVIVTHNPEIAKLATKVVYIKNGTIQRIEVVAPPHCRVINLWSYVFYTCLIYNFNSSYIFIKL